MKCAWHLCDNEVGIGSRGLPKVYCSTRCKNKTAVTKRRKLLKVMSIEYKGGRCSICGYNKCVGALHFHHLDPSIKEFRFSDSNTRSWEAIKVELDKCVLLCANCHAETHSGITFLSGVTETHGIVNA